MQISGGLGPGALNKAQGTQQTQFERLASAQKINAAKDDAAGLAISTHLDTQNRGIQTALRNSFDGISRIQVEDVALSGVSEDLQRIRELKVQQQNGILNEDDSRALQSEIDQRLESIDATLTGADFNGKKLFESGEISFQVGEKAEQKINLNTQDFASQFSKLGVEHSGSEDSDPVDSESGGSVLSLDDIDQALQVVSERRSELGAVSNRVESNTEFLSLRSDINQQASSRIQDTDFAQAISNKSKADVQFKVAIAVQGQANTNQQDVLRLLKS